MAETNRTISITARLKDQISGSLRSARQALKDVKTEIQQTNQAAGKGNLDKSMASFTLSAKAALQTMSQIKAVFGNGLASAANGLTAAFTRSRTAAAQTGQAASASLNAIGSSLKSATLAVAAFGTGVLNFGKTFLSVFGTTAIKAVSLVGKGITGGLTGAINTARAALTSFYGVVLQLLAALTIGGLVESLTDAALKLDAIAKAAVRLGFNSPQQQSAFAGLVIGAEQLGVQLDTLDASFRVFGRNISKAARGGAVEAARAFNEIGIDFEKLSNDLSSGTKTVTDALGDVADALQNVSAQRQIDIVTVLFGEVGPKFLLLIRNGREGINELIRLTQAVSNNFDKETLDNVQSLVESFRTFRTILFGLKTSILSTFAIPLRGLINQLGSIVIGIKEATPLITQFMKQAGEGFAIARAKGIDLLDTEIRDSIKLRTADLSQLTADEITKVQKAVDASGFYTQVLNTVRNLLFNLVRLVFEVSFAALRSLALEFGKILANTISQSVLKSVEIIVTELQKAPVIGNFFKDFKVDSSQKIFDEGGVLVAYTQFLEDAGAAVSKFTNSAKEDFQAIGVFLNDQFGLLDKIKNADGLIGQFEALQASLRRVQNQTEESKSGIQRFFAAASQGFKDVIQEMSNLEIQGRQLGDTIGRAFTDGIITPLEDVLFQIQDAKEAFREFFFDLFKQIGRIITQILLAKALGAVIGAFSPAGAVAPVAGEVLGPAVPGFNDGGLIPGRRTHRDSLVIGATPGEYMLDEKSSDYYGLPILEAMRKRMIPREFLSRFTRGFQAPMPKFGYNSGGSVRSGSGSQVSQPVLSLDAKFMERLLASPGGAVLARWMDERKGKVGQQA